ncbi:MAG: bacillithiol biosynthesis protein BshC [Acidobacteriota bacterium]
MSEPTGLPTTVEPLDAWSPVHPAALALSRGELHLPRSSRAGGRRSPALAQALADRHRMWGLDVDRQLDEWLAGAEVVVTGQQPGLLGGPLLTLVKACAVSAEVARLRRAGHRAVGFLWLATADDDLPEMGWGRIAVGEGVVECRETAWRRGDSVGGVATVGTECARLLDSLDGRLSGESGREAVDLARECFKPGSHLGDAAGRFLGRLLRDTGVVLVDATTGELARAGAAAVEAVLTRLPVAWEALHDGTADMVRRGWTAPLRVTPATLPLFAFDGTRRHRVATHAGACPAERLAEFRRDPTRFLPNAWVRPLVQDAVLDTSVSMLGGAELAYHLQCLANWEIAGVRRPEWRLRPHVTVVCAAERRLAAQLQVGPEVLLRAKLPEHLLGGGKTRRAMRHLVNALESRLGAVESAAGHELPALRGDLDATRKRIASGLQWLEQRIETASAKSAEVDAARWSRLRAFLRPNGRPQERELSVLAPLLKLGLDWPAQLAEVVDPGHPGNHLLFWKEGGAW